MTDSALQLKKIANIRFVIDGINSGTVVVDVGGVYDDARKRYDHHQRGFDKARPNGIKYSSAGLVWFHYGMLVMDEFGPDAQAMWDDIDMNFIAAIDATDNGQRLNETPSLVRVQTLSSLIGAMNPTWLEETGNYPDGHFDAALELAKVNIRVNALAPGTVPVVAPLAATVTAQHLSTT